MPNTMDQKYKQTSFLMHKFHNYYKYKVQSSSFHTSSMLNGVRVSLEGKGTEE